MPTADVIMPVTTANAQTHRMATIALRTCRASTDAPIWAFDNNTDPAGPWQDALRRECAALNVSYSYVEGPFNIAKIFNLGTDITTGQFIAYATSDVLYFPGWLYNIISLWKEQPEWFALCNWSFDPDNNPCVSHKLINERRIVQTHNPSAGVIVLKRSNGYRWDEQFPLWEIDADFTYYLESRGLKAGYCLNARCDHLIGAVRAHIDYAKAFALKPGESMQGAANARLKAKWGEAYKGG